MRFRPKRIISLNIVAGVAVVTLLAQEAGKNPSIYMPVDIQEGFASIMSRMSAAKAGIMQRQKSLLEERYDLSNRPASGVTMSRGKPVQEGVRVKLASGMTWETLGQMSPEQVRERDVFPHGFMPLPHPNHPEGRMLFPIFHIDYINKKEHMDFPPAPKLGVDGTLHPKRASAAEMRGQTLFLGKAKCGSCHPAPYYTDNLMHNLQAERFYTPRLINGMMASADGPIKTFPLRGIKDSPPYMHDGRLLTLED